MNDRFSSSGISGRLWPTLLLLLFAFSPAQAEEGDVSTLWPLVDYRRSEAVDYTSLHLLGPLVKYERKEKEREYALRPFYYTARDGQGNVYSEFLYPLASRRTDGESSGFQGLRLLDYDFGEEGTEDEFTLFPFVFYGDTEERGTYFAIFPLGGTIYERFNRDEIRFALFPVYGKTRKEQTTITNILWPIFARIRGEGERGWKLWPLYGTAEKEGVYRKRFYLWPIVFRYDQRLDTANPVYTRTVFPFFVRKESPRRSSRTWLWPFFRHVEDRSGNYEEWNYPWPLFGHASGDRKEGVKRLPFYSDMRLGDSRTRWYLWPLFKVEQTATDVFERRRFRVLWFLYSDLREEIHADGLPPHRRISLWPLFTLERDKGVSHLHLLSLLEPFFPENEGIERNWAPLWRLYQRKWDRQGNGVSSLLWNLYWKERRGDELAMEVFPLFRYDRRADEGTEFTLLKGLFRYRQMADGAEITMLYLPWGIDWGKGD